MSGWYFGLPILRVWRQEGTFTVHHPWLQCLTVCCSRDPSLVPSFFLSQGTRECGVGFYSFLRLDFSVRVNQPGQETGKMKWHIMKNINFLTKFTIAMHGLWLQCLPVPCSGTLSLVLSFVHRTEQGFLVWCFVPTYPSHLMLSTLFIYSPWIYNHCWLEDVFSVPSFFLREDGCARRGVNGSIFKKKKRKKGKKGKWKRPKL